MRALPGVVHFGLNLQVGTTIQPAGDDPSRHGYVIARAGNEAAMTALLTEVRETLKVHYA